MNPKAIEFTLQKLQPGDLSFARELLLEWQRQDGVTDYQLPSDVHLNRMLDREDFHVWVARAEGKVVGGLSAYEMSMFDQEQTEMFLYEIGVGEGHRRKGIARALVEALRITCAERGIEVIFVGTEPHNTAAKRLYLSTGAKEELVAWFTYGEE
jgi:aminoglycoside 3-N-acetyltransferase I